MPAVELDDAELPWEAWLDAGIEVDEPPLEPPPQPATAITSAVSTAAPAASKRDLRMVCSYLASDMPAGKGAGSIARRLVVAWITSGGSPRFNEARPE
jgi:hypothetical protein